MTKSKSEDAPTFEEFLTQLREKYKKELAAIKPKNRH